MEAVDLYGGRDPRELPTYSFHEVALSLRLPVSTLRAWTRGQPGFQPLFNIPKDPHGLNELSFYNLIESYVLVQLRRKHELSMPSIRRSIEYLQQLLDVAHPIVEADLVVVGGHIYVRHGTRRIDLTQSGQYPLEDVIRELLTRVDKGPFGIVRFYPQMPNSRGVISQRYKPVVIDPDVSFGRPCLAGTAIPTEVIAQRRRGGDSIRAIAEDYNISVKKVREAIAFQAGPAQPQAA